MSPATTAQWLFGQYTRDDLMTMDRAMLAALLRERTHHTIEVPLYPLLLKEEIGQASSFGEQAQLVFDVWHERGFPEDGADLLWVKRYLDIAARIRRGERVDLGESVPEPFSDGELATVEKLMYGRRSVRNWIDKPVPDWMIEKILDAGRMAPIGCNIGHLRFLVLKDPKDKDLIWSDCPTKKAAAIIVICHDTRASRVVGHDRVVPQNAGFDAAAAGDHMLLMAHALGLGAVWLSELRQSSKTIDTGKAFKERYGLPEYIDVDLHIAVGWAAIGTIKSARPPLESLIIRKETAPGGSRSVAHE
jgi:nitroreductase